MPEHEAENRPTTPADDQTIGRQYWEPWLVYLIRGLLALALAFFSFLWPTQTIGLFTKLLGIYFIADGLTHVLSVIGRKNNKALIAPHVVGIVIGLVLLFLSGVTARVFMIVVGLWAIIQGTGTLVAVWKSRQGAGNQSHGATVGLMMLVVGIVFTIWPTTGVVAVSWLIAFGSLFVGLVLVFMASRLWHLKSQAIEM